METLSSSALARLSNRSFAERSEADQSAVSSES